jgi:hypothetical protein
MSYQGPQSSRLSGDSVLKRCPWAQKLSLKLRDGRITERRVGRVLAAAIMERFLSHDHVDLALNLQSQFQR